MILTSRPMSDSTLPCPPGQAGDRLEKPRKLNGVRACDRRSTPTAAGWLERCASVRLYGGRRTTQAAWGCLGRLAPHVGLHYTTAREAECEPGTDVSLAEQWTRTETPTINALGPGHLKPQSCPTALDMRERLTAATGLTIQRKLCDDPGAWPRQRNETVNPKQ